MCGYFLVGDECGVICCVVVVMCWCLVYGFYVVCIGCDGKCFFVLGIAGQVVDLCDGFVMNEKGLIVGNDCVIMVGFVIDDDEGMFYVIFFVSFIVGIDELF